MILRDSSHISSVPPGEPDIVEMAITAPAFALLPFDPAVVPLPQVPDGALLHKRMDDATGTLRTNVGRHSPRYRLRLQGEGAKVTMGFGFLRGASCRLQCHEGRSSSGMLASASAYQFENRTHPN